MTKILAFELTLFTSWGMLLKTLILLTFRTSYNSASIFSHAFSCDPESLSLPFLHPQIVAIYIAVSIFFRFVYHLCICTSLCLSVSLSFTLTIAHL